MRTFLILAALVVSGIGFARLTQKGTVVTGGQGVEVPATSESELIPAKVFLTLSRPVGFLDLKVGERNVALNKGGAWQLEQKKDWEFTGDAMVDRENPVVFLKVGCLPPAGGDVPRFFAKLVVEADGQETFTHVFDAAGDIDDFVELPF